METLKGDGELTVSEQIKRNMGKKADNQERALTALLEHGSTVAAAKACGIAESTIRSYLMDPVFKERVRSGRRELYNAIIARLLSAGSQAAETLKTHLSHENPQAAIRAAQLIIDAGQKGIDTQDILERLQYLEEISEVREVVRGYED